MTFNAAGNVDASASLAAGANRSFSFDGSTKYETQLTIKNTPGGSVAAVRGVRIDVFPRYGTGPSDTTLANPSFTLPSQTASTAESIMIRLGPGKYTVKLTNLDATNAVTLEATTATVD
jgi:hypothetical protein